MTLLVLAALVGGSVIKEDFDVLGEATACWLEIEGDEEVSPPSTDNNSLIVTFKHISEIRGEGLDIFYSALKSNELILTNPLTNRK